MSCEGVEDGAINVYASGGTGYYNYTLDGINNLNYLNNYGFFSLLIERSFSNQVIRLNLQKAGDHVFVHLHDDSEVVEVAVVRCCEDRHQFSTSKELVPVFLHLMRSADQVDVVLLIEVLHNDFSKSVRNSSVILAPVDYIFFWVCGVTPK